MYSNTRRRWPKGTWMRLVSAERLRSFVGPEPTKKMSGRQLALRVINPDTGRPIHPSFIDHLVSGRKTSCKPRIAERIAEVLEVPLDVLFIPRVPSATQVSAKRQTVAA